MTPLRTDGRCQADLTDGQGAVRLPPGRIPGLSRSDTKLPCSTNYSTSCSSTNYRSLQQIKHCRKHITYSWAAKYGARSTPPDSNARSAEATVLKSGGPIICWNLLNLLKTEILSKTSVFRPTRFEMCPETPKYKSALLFIWRRRYSRIAWMHTELWFPGAYRFWICWKTRISKFNKMPPQIFNKLSFNKL